MPFGMPNRARSVTRAVSGRFRRARSASRANPRAPHVTAAVPCMPESMHGAPPVPVLADSSIHGARPVPSGMPDARAAFPRQPRGVVSAAV